MRTDAAKFLPPLDCHIVTASVSSLTGSGSSGSGAGTGDGSTPEVVGLMSFRTWPSAKFLAK
jgi:hypothetical protein